MTPQIAIAWMVGSLLLAVLVTAVATRWSLPAPLVLVTIAAGIGFVPGVPIVEVEPELVLYGLLPPLLFATARRQSIIDLRAEGDGIVLLSIGLVVFTTVFVGIVTSLVVPGIGAAAALALGAVVAPTDAVSVAAVTGSVGIERRMSTVLEGESLFNDATALVALGAAIAAIGSGVTAWSVSGEFVLAVAAGLLVGGVTGAFVSACRPLVGTVTLSNALSLAAPLAAFVAAEAIGGSGALAVVIAGLWLAARSPTTQSAAERITEATNWRTIEFFVNSAVFILIGLSLRGIVDDFATQAPPWLTTVGICVAVLVAVFVARLAWFFFVTAIYRHGPQRLQRRDWSWRGSLVLSFAGMRGVVTLAAVFLLPTNTPDRALLQLLAFVVVVGSLLQSLTLPLLIQRLGIESPDLGDERRKTLRLLGQARNAGLDRLDAVVTDSDDDRVLERLRLDAAFLGDAIENPGDDPDEHPTVAYRRLRKMMLDAEHDAVLDAQRNRTYDETVIRQAQRIIDAEESPFGAPRES